MKKLLFISVFLIMGLIVLSGCSNSSNIESAKKEHNIDKIVLLETTGLFVGLEDYQKYTTELVETIAEKHKIPVEIFTISNHAESLKYLNDGYVDLVGMYNLSEEQENEYLSSYTYFDKPRYFPNGIEFDSYYYHFISRKDDEELMSLIDKEIVKMQQSGELEELQNKYFEEREILEHVSLKEVLTLRYMNNLSPEEKDKLDVELDEYMKFLDEK